MDMTKYERSDFRVFVEGKRVAIVGGAESILGTGQGVEIDSHEVILRINLRVPRRFEYADVGRRVTGFYAGDILHISDVSIQRQKGVVLFSPEHWWKTQTVYGIRTFDKNRKFIDDLMKTLWHPLKEDSPYNKNTSGLEHTTGVVCLFDCLLHNAASISLFGFDCFNTPDRYRVGDEVPSETVYIVSEAKRLKILMQNNEYPIIIDSILQKVLDDFPLGES